MKNEKEFPTGIKFEIIATSAKREDAVNRSRHYVAKCLRHPGGYFSFRRDKYKPTRTCRGRCVSTRAELIRQIVDRKSR